MPLESSQIELPDLHKIPLYDPVFWLFRYDVDQM